MLVSFLGRCLERQLGLLQSPPVPPFLNPGAEAIEIKVNHWCGVKGERLRKQESADDGDAERSPQLAAGSTLEGERQSAEQRRSCRHHDGAKTQQARLINR